MTECPSESSHDYVVTGMDMGTRGLLCLYTVECSRCGDTQWGYADDIPPARFPTSDDHDSVAGLLEDTE